YLDVQPGELRVGLQPASVGERTCSIFLADALENGAGYASHLGEEAHLAAVLARICDQERTEHLETSGHASVGDTNSPDCLRSYDNLRLHSRLDWRLALDVAELADGRTLNEGRWLSLGERLSSGFISAFFPAGGCERLDVDGIFCLAASSDGPIVVLGHP